MRIGVSVCVNDSDYFQPGGILSDGKVNGKMCQLKLKERDVTLDRYALQKAKEKGGAYNKM
jgi:hypothetical protein